jgi:hypothetical protein
MNILDLKRKAQGWSLLNGRGGDSISKSTAPVNTWDKTVTQQIGRDGGGKNSSPIMGQVANTNYQAPSTVSQLLINAGVSPELANQVNSQSGAAYDAAINSLGPKAGQSFFLGNDAGMVKGTTGGKNADGPSYRAAAKGGWYTPKPSGGLFGSIGEAFSNIGSGVGGMAQGLPQFASDAAKSPAGQLAISMIAPNLVPGLAASVGSAGAAGIINGGVNFLQTGNLDSALKAGVTGAVLGGMKGPLSSLTNGMSPYVTSAVNTGANTLARGVLSGKPVNFDNIAKGFAGNLAGGAFGDITGSAALGNVASGLVKGQSLQHAGTNALAGEAGKFASNQVGGGALGNFAGNIVGNTSYQLLNGKTPTERSIQRMLAKEINPQMLAQITSPRRNAKVNVAADPTSPLAVASAGDNTLRMAKGGKVPDEMSYPDEFEAEFERLFPGSTPKGMMEAIKRSLNPSLPVVGVGGLAHGGSASKAHPDAPEGHYPEFISGESHHLVEGRGNGQSDDVPAMLRRGDYVVDADLVAALGDGSTEAGSGALEKLMESVKFKDSGDSDGAPIPAKIAKGEVVLPSPFVTALGKGDNEAGSAVLDKMRKVVRKHKRSAPIDKIPPPAKSPLAYISMALKGK